MAVEVTALVWPLKLTPPQKLVLLKLADHARADGSEARPSITRIENETGLVRSTVQAALKHLKGEGIIHLQRAANLAQQQPAVYRLDLDRLRALTPPTPVRKGSYPISPDGIGGVAVGETIEERSSIGEQPIPAAGLDLYRHADEAIPPAGPKPSLNHPTSQLASSGASENGGGAKQELGLPAAAKLPTVDIAKLGAEILGIVGYPRDSVLHFAPITAWLCAGYTADEIRTAAHSIAQRIPGGMRNPLAWMSKAMPDEVAAIRRAAAGQQRTPAHAEPPPGLSNWRLRFWKAHGAAAYEGWVKTASEVRDGPRLVLAFPTAFVRDWVRNNFGDKLRQLIRLDDKSVERIDFEVAAEPHPRIPAGRRTA